MAPAFFWFFLITTIFLYIRYAIVDTYDRVSDPTDYKSTLSMWAFIYFLIVTVIQVIMNWFEMKKCDSSEWMAVIFWTVTPNVLIFGLLLFLIIAFPGWKAPFANTFGYVVTLMSGLRPLLQTVLHDGSGASQEEKTNILIKKIYSNPTDIINEITPTNWQKWVKHESIRGIFKDQYQKKLNIDKNDSSLETRNLKKLFKLVVIRDLTSEFIWYMIVGMYIIATQANSLTKLRASLQCMRKPEEVKRMKEDVCANDEEQEEKEVSYIVD